VLNVKRFTIIPALKTAYYQMIFSNTIKQTLYLIDFCLFFVTTQPLGGLGFKSIQIYHPNASSTAF
jgi:hypothetical protein